MKAVAAIAINTTTTMITTMTDATTHNLDAAGLHKLLAWTSPSFPVGAFSYSHGLEWAVEAGTLTNAATVVTWLEDILRHGSGRNDGVLLAAAWRSSMDRDSTCLQEIAALALALSPSAERHLETVAQGNAFRSAILGAWPAEGLDLLETSQMPDIPYPVALGIAAAAHRLALAPTLQAYLHGVTANLVSAAVRLIPLGQTDGQRTISALAPTVDAVATACLDAGLDELGGCAWIADITSMNHETQYTRLFRS